MNVAARKPADRHVMWKVKGRKRNRDYRTREHLTQDELDRLFAALKRNRHGHRDYMVALVTFLHGLRVSELIDLRWDDIDWRKGTMQIRRLKGSIDGVHYLEPDEAKGLKRLQREQEPTSRYIFTSERGEQFSRFAINKMIETAGRNADIDFPVIRTACGILPARCRPMGGWMPGDSRSSWGTQAWRTRPSTSP